MCVISLQLVKCVKCHGFQGTSLQAGRSRGKKQNSDDIRNGSKNPLNRHCAFQNSRTLHAVSASSLWLTNPPDSMSAFSVYFVQKSFVLERTPVKRRGRTGYQWVRVASDEHFPMCEKLFRVRPLVSRVYRTRNSSARIRRAPRDHAFASGLQGYQNFYVVPVTKPSSCLCYVWIGNHC